MHMLVDGEERWVLDGVPAELSEQAYMWQREEGLDGSSTGRIDWSCSGWKPGAEEEQIGTVCWKGIVTGRRRVQKSVLQKGQRSSCWVKGSAA